MDNTINEYLKYMKTNNLNDNISDYFTSYAASNHPEAYQEFKTPVLNTSDLNNENVMKINNPIINSSKKFNFNFKQPEVTSYLSEQITNNPDINNTNFKNKIDFIKAILPEAEKIANEKGIDVNIILSQAAFESGYGKNTLTKKANNIFSIQGKGFAHRDKNQKGEIYNIDFKKYNNLGESLKDWANMVLNPNSKRYNKSYLAAKQNPEEFFKTHAWSGYAEGIGKTKEEAKQGIYKGYKLAYNDILKLRKENNL